VFTWPVNSGVMTPTDMNIPSPVIQMCLGNEFAVMLTNTG